MINHATGAFWLAYAPIEVTDAALFSTPDAGEAAWIRAAITESYRDIGLNDAVSALALSRMSQITGDRRARREALMFYGSCVRNVRRSILRSDKVQDDTLLATVMLLATFELHEGTFRRDSAWAAHVNGASKLINARGGSSISTEFGRTLFMGHLRSELIYGISSRGQSRRGMHKTTYLPVTNCKSADNLDAQLIHILSTMPSIMGDADGILLISEPTLLIRSMTALLDMCSDTLSTLEAFSSSITASSYPAPLYLELPSPLYASLPEDSPLRVFSEYFHFTSLSLASLQLTTWTSILLIHSTLYLTWEHVRQNYPSLSIDARLPITARIPTHGPTYVDNLTLSITQSLEYFILPEQGLQGASQLGYAIPVSMGYMSYWRWPEQAWFKMLFSRMKELNLGVEGFLADMFRNQELRLIRPLDSDLMGRDEKGMPTLVNKGRRTWDGSVFGGIVDKHESREEEVVEVGWNDEDAAGDVEDA